MSAAFSSIAVSHCLPGAHLGDKQLETASELRMRFGVVRVIEGEGSTHTDHSFVISANRFVSGMGVSRRRYLSKISARG